MFCDIINKLAVAENRTLAGQLKFNTKLTKRLIEGLCYVLWKDLYSIFIVISKICVLSKYVSRCCKCQLGRMSCSSLLPQIVFMRFVSCALMLH